MAEELQHLLEKIQHDGVEKANAASAAIAAEAKARADAIVREAEAKAEAVRAKAESDAAAFEERSRNTVRQAARDAVLEVKASIARLLEGLLAKDVHAALSNGANAASLVMDAIRTAGTDAEVAAGAKLVEALRAELAKEAAGGGLKVVLDESTGAGFSVRLDGGRVEHDFSEAAIAKSLARRLRPDLAALVK